MCECVLFFLSSLDDVEVSLSDSENERGGRDEERREGRNEKAVEKRKR